MTTSQLQRTHQNQHHHNNIITVTAPTQQQQTQIHQKLLQLITKFHPKKMSTLLQLYTNKKNKVITNNHNHIQETKLSQIIPPIQSKRQKITHQTSSNQKPNQQNHEDPFYKVTPLQQNTLFIKEVEYAMNFLQQIANYILSPELLWKN